MECDNIMEGYLNYLKKDLFELKDESKCEIELPFPKPDGEGVIVSINKKGDLYFISDKGFMDEYLFLNGLDLWKLPDKPNETFLHLRRMYHIISKSKPEITIKVKEADLFLGIYNISNIISELSSLKLLTPPVSFSYFKSSIKLFLDENKYKYKIDPPRLDFELNKVQFSFQLDFLFYKNRAHVKLISSDSIIKDWALRFIKIKRYYTLMKNPINLWVIYNDKEDVKSDEIYKWFGEDMDAAFAWYSEKERILQLI